MAVREERVWTLNQLNDMSAEELLSWAHDVHGDRAAIITSFQDTGCVMVDMACSRGVPLRVLTVDTLRLHDETYQLMDAVEDRYGIRVERFKPDPQRVQQMVKRHGEYLFFDSREKQEFCCKIRKVEPNQRALETVDVWITGLRRSQSNFRGETPKASYVEQGDRRLLKLAPLADWSDEQVWEYIRERDVPYNPLYDQDYTSIGCIICTTPTKPGEDKRAGRWRWFNRSEDEDHKECGIHIGGSGI
jgi:phosphoadenylyl-sulfate reductase (thioredoxin)